MKSFLIFHNVYDNIIMALSCFNTNDVVISTIILLLLGMSVAFVYLFSNFHNNNNRNKNDDSIKKLSSSSSISSSISSSSTTTTTTNTTDEISSMTSMKTSTTTKPSKIITWNEFKKHTGSSTSKEEKCWIALYNKVYDITNFAPVHPGGDLIFQYAGRDATDEFEAFHLPRVKRRLAPFYIGDLVDAPVELPVTKDYRELKQYLWDEGWFEADLSYYVYKDILALCILLIGAYFITMGESTITRTIIGGSFVGLALQQVAFVAHDAGHRGITHPIPGGGINWLGWLHGSICFGVSIEMWNDEHSAHHVMTMRPHEDPQFKYLPVFLISSKEVDRFGDLSKIEQKIAKWLVPFQHYTLIPISVIIGRFNLHIISLIYAIKSRKYYDIGGLLLYLAWFGSLTSYLPLYERMPFVLVSYIVAGILHIQLTISHLATNSFTAEEDEKEQFFAFQCKTTRNINSTEWDDWFHGGLQFQIEHHLFPQMPRHNLVKVKPFVENLCRKYNLPYQSTSFMGAVGHCLSDFRRLSFFLEDIAYPHEIMPK